MDDFDLCYHLHEVTMSQCLGCRAMRYAVPKNLIQNTCAYDVQASNTSVLAVVGGL